MLLRRQVVAEIEGEKERRDRAEGSRGSRGNWLKAPGTMAGEMLMAVAVQLESAPGREGGKKKRRKGIQRWLCCGSDPVGPCAAER